MRTTKKMKTPMKTMNVEERKVVLNDPDGHAVSEVFSEDRPAQSTIHAMWRASKTTMMMKLQGC
jgi:sarcosine oxidase gamma subunit